MEVKVSSTEDVLKTFASNEVLQDFLDDDFDVQSYATKVIRNAAISQQLAQLFNGISLLDKELQSQISARHGDLLAQATGIESLEGILAMMQTRINTLQSAVDRIRVKVGEPFSKIQSRTTQLSRMQATCDMLRRIIRIQRLTKHLHTQLQGGARELTRAAQSLSELDYLSTGVDLSGIDVIDGDRAFIDRAREEVNTQACRLLDQGMAALNQTHTATALQVFYNLNCLHSPVQRALREAEKNVVDSIATALDIRALMKKSGGTQTGKGPGVASGNLALGNMPQFCANLWKNMETLSDQLFSVTNQMIHLHKVLAKKRDPQTHVEFADELAKRGDVYFVKRFWETLTGQLKEELFNRTNSFNHVRQAFEGEYPKLLQLFNELWAKLNPNKDILQGVASSKKESSAMKESLVNPGNVFDPERALKSIIRSFETSYLQRSISRLFDPINLVFPQGGRNAPSNDEMEAIVKTISSEIGVACVDESFEVTVARNVSKTIQLFAVKSEQLISTQSDASQVIAAPNAAQMRNIAVVNSLYALQSNVLKLVEEQHMLSQEAQEIISTACHNLSMLMANAVAPLVSSVAKSIEAIILTMHNENFVEDIRESGESTLCSLYMKELRDFIARVVHDHFKSFHCQSFVAESLIPVGQRAIDVFIRHASLVRPIKDSGNMKLAADFAQMELAISPLCRRLTDLGLSYRLLRSFRPLLFQSEEAICESSSVGDVIPCSTALHYLFCRAPTDVLSPHQIDKMYQCPLYIVGYVCPYRNTVLSLTMNGTRISSLYHAMAMNWPVSKYNAWLDEHPNEKERLNMIRGAIEKYVNKVRASQQTHFATVYPFMVKLLQRGMDKLAASAKPQ